jgi:AbrB family looped-hinge helix DNA binding protein
MKKVSTTKISSKGQVVIPEQIRKSMGLQQGAEFVVVADKDAIILKTIQPPSVTGFSSLLKKATVQAKKAGLKKESIKKAIKKARS